MTQSPSIVFNPVIISLASYNKRLPKIKQTFKTIVNQTVPYSKIIVNVQDDLTEQEFTEFEKLKEYSPKVEVIKRPAKWKSFNKYVHTYKENPNAIIITCDDDIFYEPTFFDALLTEYRKHPECIICHEVNPMSIRRDKSFTSSFRPIYELKIEMQMSLDIKLKQKEFGKYMTGCCLFPPNCFNASTIAIDDYDKFMELTNAVHDEIWLWTLSTLLGIQCICLDNTMSFDLDKSAMIAEEFALSKINGDIDNIHKYEEKINALYGEKLIEKMRETPCVFPVNRCNLLAYIGNMAWINRIFHDFNVVFECDEDEILRSHLTLLVNAINSQNWYYKVNVKHDKFLKGNCDND